MLLDRTHKKWCAGTLIAAAVATGVYVPYALSATAGPRGGTLPGLMFGIAGSVLMIFAGLLAARRRLPRWRIGSAQFWLRGHIWLGLLSILLILFHSGFGFGGTLETFLMLAFILVVASGLFGLGMQQILPQLITNRVPIETFNEQVPFLCRRLQAQSDVIVAEVGGTVECEYKPIEDAAYNLADSMGALRNGKEEEDFRKFLGNIYVSAAQENEKAAANRAAAKPKAAKPAELKAAHPPTAKAAPQHKPPASPKPPVKPAAAKRNDELAEPESSPAAPKRTAETPAKAPAPQTPATNASTAAQTLTAAEDAEKPASEPQPAAAAKPPAAAKKPLPAGKPAAAGKPAVKPKPGAPTMPAAARTKPGAKPARPAAKAKAKPTVPAPRIDELKRFHTARIRPFLAYNGDRSQLSAPLNAKRLFNQTRTDLPAALHGTLNRLEALCDERRQFLLQQRIHRWLHWWLAVHIPVSIVLFVLFVAHVVVALRVIPWSF